MNIMLNASKAKWLLFLSALLHQGCASNGGGGSGGYTSGGVYYGDPYWGYGGWVVYDDDDHQQGGGSGSGGGDSMRPVRPAHPIALPPAQRPVQLPSHAIPASAPRPAMRGGGGGRRR